MRRTTIVFSALLALSASGTSLAAGAMKPGLWEMTMKSDAMKAMPALSPQQMEQMRKAGVNVPQMQAGGMVTKVCISKEMAERDQPPAAREDSGPRGQGLRAEGRPLQQPPPRQNLLVPLQVERWRVLPRCLHPKQSGK